MEKITLQVAGRTVNIYGAATLGGAVKNGSTKINGAVKNDAAEISGAVKIVYLHIFDPAEGAAVYEKLEGACILAAISGCSWENDFTPWPAPAIDKRQGKFEGGAPAYLQTLTEEIMPAVEKQVGLPIQKRIVAGYSLAGLFAVYAACVSHSFDGVASASGSLWYDGFTDWAKENYPRGRWDGLATAPVYLSLGDRESRSKNARLQQNENALRAVAASWEPHTRLKVEMNPGGHFQDAELRTAKGIAWVLSQV
jgi:predicted alpha/beta superfamily hydrolase